LKELLYCPSQGEKTFTTMKVEGRTTFGTMKVEGRTMKD